VKTHALAMVVAVGLPLSSSFAEAKVIAVVGNDSAAITAAINHSSPGDTVSLPAGTFTITGPIQPKSQTNVKGAGQDKTIVRFVGDRPAVMLQLSSCQEVEVSDLTLDGAGNPNASQGITAGGARRLNVHHVTIRNLVKSKAFGPHGILFSGTNPTRQNGVTDSVIADCRIENIGVGADFGGGIRLSWGSSRNRILRNTIGKTGRGGIFGDNGSTDLEIRGNTVSGSGGEGLGIEVWGGCDRAVIEDNRIDHWLSFGGCDWGAARRNVIGDTSGEYKFCGIEAVGSYLVLTDNTIDGGQKIGLSVSADLKKDYVFWARNTVRDCNQWGAQLQGETAGIAYHYFYRCTFSDMPVGKGKVWYPGDEGHGFRTCGNVSRTTFEECEFSGNGRFGLQLIGAKVDQLTFIRCVIKGNKGPAVVGPGDYSALEWVDCVVAGNGSNALPAGKPFGHAAPVAAFDAPKLVRVGEPATFVHASRAAKGKIAALLWDFGDGLPSIDAQPVHTYHRRGTYRVTLLAWDDAGRAGRAEREVKVEP